MSRSIEWGVVSSTFKVFFKSFPMMKRRCSRFGIWLASRVPEQAAERDAEVQDLREAEALFEEKMGVWMERLEQLSARGLETLLTRPENTRDLSHRGSLRRRPSSSWHY